MNLQQTISKITGLTVSEEDAMCYARDNFATLETYVRLSKETDAQIAVLESLKEVIEGKESRIKELEEQLNKTAFDLQCQTTENQQYREALSNMVVFHEYNASYDKDNNGYYAAKRLLNNPKIQ